MQRPRVLFFDSNESMLDLAGRDMVAVADQLLAMPK
jgi:hypothetical protein